MQLNRLSTRLEIKKVEKDGQFEGYASVFDVQDSQRDIIAPGAFSASLREKGVSKIKLLWQHNPGQPIGVWMEMFEDKTGLFVKGQLILDVQQAAEAHALMKAGALDGLSIGFRTVKSEWDEDDLVRTITEVDLWEVSPVTFPANEEALISAVKAAEGIETPREFEKFLRDSGFPRAFAIAAASQGFEVAKQLSGQRDSDGELTELADSIRGITANLTR